MSEYEVYERCDTPTTRPSVERERNETARSEDVCPRSSEGSRDEVPGPGQYADKEWEDDLYYNWNRYYIPHIGRYNRADPLGIVEDNFYAYSMNNPMNILDPFGLWACPVGSENCSFEKMRNDFNEIIRLFNKWNSNRTVRPPDKWSPGYDLRTWGPIAEYKDTIKSKFSNKLFHIRNCDLYVAELQLIIPTKTACCEVIQRENPTTFGNRLNHSWLEIHCCSCNESKKVDYKLDPYWIFPNYQIPIY